MNGDIHILERPSVPEPNPSTDRAYTLGIRAESVGARNALAFLFATYPPDYDPAKDDPLEMSVLKAASGGRLVIRLDPAWNWRFRTGDPAITLGESENPTIPPAADHYWNLTVSPDGMEATFHADYLDDPAYIGNVDPYNIYVELDQSRLGDLTFPPLILKLDRDIKNPGDYG